MAERIGNIVKEDAKVIWTNFKGLPDDLNPDGGKRMFNLVLDEDEAEVYVNDGWNVKAYHRKNDKGEVESITYYLPCRVRFDGGRPPKVVMVTDRNAIELDEDTVGNLDDVTIVSCDVEITPYHWKIKGRGEGYTAYLKTMYATIEETDRFSDKYRNRFANEDSIPFG